MTSALAVIALRNAVILRGCSAVTVVHSDRGSQFRSDLYQRELRSAQLRGSMGRVGTCADNAAMEPFLSFLQKNVRIFAERKAVRLSCLLTHHQGHQPYRGCRYSASQDNDNDND